MERKRKRGENWTSAEKQLLQKLVAPSHDIIENKSNTTTVVNLKKKEWKCIMTRFNKITGKNRSAAEMKFAWKRFKKVMNVSIKSENQDNPTEDATDLEYSNSDFAIPDSDFNHYDEDASQLRGNIEVIVERNLSDEETMTNSEKRLKKGVKMMDVSENGSCKDNVKDLEMKFVERQMEILEEEHKYNVKIAQLRIQKLELEIALLGSSQCANTRRKKENCDTAT